MIEKKYMVTLHLILLRTYPLILISMTKISHQTTLYINNDNIVLLTGWSSHAENFMKTEKNSTSMESLTTTLKTSI